MIIVNQDKSEIINFDNTLNICLYPKYDDLDNEIGFEIFAGMKAPDDNYRTLGCYKTEERAKEVLKEIIAEYSKYLRLPGGAAIFKGGMDIQPNVFNVPKVFEMPEE